MSDTRSPLARARDAFLSSAMGQGLLRDDILLSPRQAKYLRNRIEAAFVQGSEWRKWNAISQSTKASTDK